MVIGCGTPKKPAAHISNADFPLLETRLSSSLPDPLGNYLSLLDYTPSNALKSASRTADQQAFNVTASTSFSDVQVAFFSDTNCSNLIDTVVLGTAGGTPIDMSAGTYTSSDQSNYALCQAFSYNSNTGCSAEASNTNSLQYTYITDTYVLTSGCMNRGGSGEHIQDTVGSTSCSSGSSCGFSQAYTYNLVQSTAALALSTNSNFSCATTNSLANNLTCWGAGTNGQLGQQKNTPTLMALPTGVTQWSTVSVAPNTGTNGCAIAGEGSNAGLAYCWGSGSYGQIGNGANNAVSVPTAVTMPSGVTAFGSLSTNYDFSCAIASAGSNAGTVYCWGYNLSGQLGIGSNSNVNVPTSVTMPSGVTAFGSLSSNYNSSCAIASAGSNAGNIYCWGINSSGQIGNGANSNVTVPTLATLPAGETGFSSVSTNNSFSCAVANSGNIYCWGAGTSGQIGNGSSSNVNVPTLATLPSGVTAFSSLSTNDDFSCAIASAGTNAGNIYCWGYGAQGQIGNGANSSVNVPTLAILPSGVTAFGSVSTNTNFSCAIASAGTNAGNIYCWGYGAQGQIGNGANSSVNVPTLTTLPSSVTAFGSVSTNITSSCAIASAGSNAGNIYCWGIGTSGQIGNGSSSNVNVPTLATLPSGVTAFGSVSIGNSFPCGIASSGSNAGNLYCWSIYLNELNSQTSVPLPSGVTSFSAISSNTSFSCGLAGSGANMGTIYCWGSGSSGQIGNGTTNSTGFPTAVTMPEGVSFTSISTNSNFSCALAIGGAIYCWGIGTSGQIGNGGTSSVDVPTSVTMPSGVTAFGSLSTNIAFSCAIASAGTNAGKIYCWGIGSSGRIGNGGNSTVSVPTLVTTPAGVMAFSAVSTNNNFSCAIASAGSNAGKIYCWGSGSSGQIGNGGNSTVSVPTLVTTPAGVMAFSAVSTNTGFSCAIASAGSNAGKIYCWGIGSSGQIGNGFTNNVNVPTLAPFPTGVTAFGSVSTNSSFSCAIASAGTNAGKIYCWGIGTSGQIGNGANSTVHVPTLVTTPAGVTAFSAVSTNTGFSCAIASAGSNAGNVYCWGSGTTGQIGNGADSSVNVPTLAAFP